jgi:hypothetical protein
MGVKAKAHHLRTEWLLMAGLAAVALTTRVVPGERTVDDAYITFRYARNLVEGLGFVYNPGEQVLGTTTPLYTLLMAGLALLSGTREFPTLALYTNALAGSLAVVLLYRLGRRLADHPAPAVASALAWAVAPFSVSFAVGGMETDLTIALLLAASYAHLTGRARTMAALSALALLARPDTAVLLGLLWLDHVLATRRIPWREGLVALALLAPWLVYATLAFGSPLTSSVATKSVVYLLPPASALARLIQHYSTPFFANALLGRHWHLAGFAVYLLLYSVGALRAIRSDRRTWPLAAYPYAYLAVFGAANPLIFRWYLSPPLPLYFAFIFAGAWALFGDLARLLVRHTGREAGDRRPARGIQFVPFALLAGAALALTLNAWELHPDHGPDRPAPEMAWFGGETVYRRIALDLVEQIEPGDVVAIADIGTFGYYSDAPILDLVGLVSPASRSYYPVSADLHANALAIPTELVLDRQPEYVVLMEVYVRHTLLESGEFDARYEVIDAIDTDILQSSAFVVFRRRGSHTDEPLQ